MVKMKLIDTYHCKRSPSLDSSPWLSGQWELLNKLDQLRPPGLDALSRQAFSQQVDTRARKSFSSIMDTIDDTSKIPQCQQSPTIHRPTFDQAMCSRHPRHYNGRHYSRRRSANNAEASTSGGGMTPFCDGKMSLELASKCYSDSGHNTESRQSELQKPERGAPSFFATNVISSDVNKQFCGICRKPLRKKCNRLDHSSTSSSEPSVVAVLVCGHFYHADCLEQRTHHEDVTDPPCPICLGLLSQVDTSARQD